MNYKKLEDSINSGDIDNALVMIEDIGEAKSKEALPILIKYLQSTDNNILRNKIALALSDIGSHEAIEPLISMLSSSKTIGSRGTLLYALEPLDYSSHIELIMKLLFEENFEVSRHSLILIESMIKEIDDGIKNKYRVEIRTHIDSLYDKIDFLLEALDVLA